VIFGSPPDSSGSGSTDGSSYDQVRGNVVTLDGTSGYLRLPDHMLQNAGTSLAVSVTFKTSKPSSGTYPGGVLLSTGQDVPANNNQGSTTEMYIGTDGKLYAQWANGAVNPMISLNQVADGQWHTATLVGSGAAQTLYLDNDTPVQSNATAPLQVYEPEVFVGAGVFPAVPWVNAPGGNTTVHSSYFAGQITDVSFYSTTLAQAPLAQRHPVTTNTGIFTAGVGNNLCLNDDNGKIASGNAIETWTCTGTSNEEWSLTPYGTIVFAGTGTGSGSTNSGDCLDVATSDTTGWTAPNNTPIQLRPCAGTPNQQWVLRSNNSLYNPSSGRCLDDPGSSTTPGAKLQVYTCNNSTAQQWIPTIHPVVPITGTIVGNGLCLDDTNSSSANYNAVQLSTCGDSSAQNWTVQPWGAITLAQYPGKCLDVYHSGVGDGVKVDLYDCDGTGAQQWQPNLIEGTLWNPESTECLDWGAGTSGTQAQIWSCNQTPRQQWVIP
jgi:hypothetical protein